MRIVLIRHGHPDYAKDCLTELGQEQAKKAAVRLQEEGICEIYASSCGRAKETAAYTAELLSQNIKIVDFMREIKWGSSNGGELYEDGHPWNTAAYALSLGCSLMEESWLQNPPFSNNIVLEEVRRVKQEADQWLETLGYRREGDLYRVVGEDTDRTVALFSHGGSSTALLSRLLNIPFFYLCRALCPDFTAITVISLSDEKGMLTAPTIEYANDARHIKGGSITYQM